MYKCVTHMPWVLRKTYAWTDKEEAGETEFRLSTSGLQARHKSDQPVTNLTSPSQISDSGSIDAGEVPSTSSIQVRGMHRPLQSRQKCICIRYKPRHAHRDTVTAAGPPTHMLLTLPPRMTAAPPSGVHMISGAWISNMQAPAPVSVCMTKCRLMSGQHVRCVATAGTALPALAC